MIDQCHRRGMELHAWINPYRAKTKFTHELAMNHVAVAQPSRCFDYDGLKILNPGIPENRDYICKVVSDIVTRYDIDGLHMDDYFYPYPAAGQIIPDDAQYQRYNNGIKEFLTDPWNLVGTMNPFVLGARVLYRYIKAKERQRQEMEMMKRSIIAKQQAIIKKMEEESYQNEEQRKNMQETIDFLEEALQRIEEAQKNKRK
jgi:DNA-binding transcriptional regulator of glucitol operon